VDLTPEDLSRLSWATEYLPAKVRIRLGVPSDHLQQRPSRVGGYSERESRALVEAIGRLPGSLRDAFVQRYVEGKSAEEVASGLQLTKEEVYTRLASALLALRGGELTAAIAPG
jgi:DNA-directed RNA polymerase specialized sigma24 family protein